MAPQTLKHLLTVVLAASNVYAGLCKPSSGTSSIVTFTSASSGVETWSTTALSTASSAAETTTTEPETPGCIPCQEAVLKDDAPPNCGRRIEHWNISQSAIIDSVSFTSFDGRCESRCSNDCRCRAFTKNTNGCVFYSQGERELQPEDFDGGDRLYDMSCFECDHMG